MTTVKYLMSGRLGDFIHCMYVPFAKHLSTGTKCIVYITDDTKYGGDRFAKSLEDTYLELKPIILAQDYIESFSIHQGEQFDVNLNEFRRVIYSRGNWVELLSKHFGVPIFKQPWIKWINHLKSSEDLSDTVVIHRNMTYRDRTNGRFNSILNEIILRKKCVFLTTEQRIYDEFIRQMDIDPKDVPSYEIKTLSELVSILSTCKYYIGNQTSPTAFAVAMYRPMLCESMVLRNVYAFEEFYDDFTRIVRTSKEDKYLELIK